MRGIILAALITCSFYTQAEEPLPEICQTMLSNMDAGKVIMNELVSYTEGKASQAKVKNITKQIQDAHKLFPTTWKKIQELICVKDAEQCAIEKAKFIKDCENSNSEIQNKVEKMKVLSLLLKQKYKDQSSSTKPNMAIYTAELPKECETYVQQAKTLIKQLEAEKAPPQQISVLQESIKLIHTSMAEIASLNKESVPKEMQTVAKEMTDKMLRDMGKKCQSMSKTIAPVLNS